MSQDLPDWTRKIIIEQTGTLISLGEVAARQSIVFSYDRRGEALWWDDFEHGFTRWVTVTGGAGSSIGTSNLWPRSGTTSIEAAVDANSGNYARMKRYGWPPVSGKWGVEVAATWDVNCRQVSLQFEVQRGGLACWMMAKIEVQSGELLVVDSVGSDYVVATGLSLKHTAWQLHNLKIVGDITNQAWVRVLLDGTEYPITGVPLYTYANASADYSCIWVQAKNTVAGTAFEVYFDDVILTRGEP